MSKNRITFTDDFVLRDEKVGIGTTNPTSTLTVIGDTNISGTVNATSYSGTIALNSIHSTSTGVLTTTNNTENQVLSNISNASVLSSRFQVSVACTGQLAGSYENPSSASVGSLTAGSFYIPGTYTNIPLYNLSGFGTDARANITINGTNRTVGFTSAYNTLVTTSDHGLVGTNQPVSFASSIIRAEYVTLVDSDILYTPVPHGIGTSEPVSFASSIFDASYTGIAVTAGTGTTYFATGTGSTSFTLQYSSGGSQVTGIGSTSFNTPGNRVFLPGFSVNASTIYYATSIGTTAFTLASQSTGIGTVVGIAISTGLSIGATISGGISIVSIVYPGSGYTSGAALTVFSSNLNSNVGTGFSFAVSNVYTNYQTTDILVLTSQGAVGTSTCDFMEYATLSNDSLLGGFDAVSIGNTSQLRISPIFKDNTIRFVRTDILR
jgi:hypothetical protein